MARKKAKTSGATNKKLPLNQSIPLGIQHVLAMFAGNITVPIIIAGIFGQTPEQKIFLIQMALFVAGVATIIQTVDGTICESRFRGSLYRCLYRRNFSNVDW